MSRTGLKTLHKATTQHRANCSSFLTERQNSCSNRIHPFLFNTDHTAGSNIPSVFPSDPSPLRESLDENNSPPPPHNRAQYLPMTINASQGQRCPGELHGLEVNQGPSSSLPFDSLLVHWALGGRAIEDGHHLQGQAMNNVNAAIVKSQSQTWGEKATNAEQATPPAITQTSPGEAATTESPCGNKTAPKRLWAGGPLRIWRPCQRFTVICLLPRKRNGMARKIPCL